MTIEAQPRVFDLRGYLALHSNDLMILLLVATAITVGHWRYWFYPDDMARKDGTLDPRAGTINIRRVVGDFLFMPTGIVAGIIVMGFTLSMAIACAVVVFVVFVGSAFLMTTVEQARDGALGVFLQALTSWLPGGRK
jgi:disulfide bond formation protein DsbB